MQLTDEERKERNERIEKEIRRRKIHAFGGRFADASFSKTSASDAGIIRQINAFLEKKRDFLLMLGAPGTGKTYNCSALMDWVLSRGYTIRAYSEVDLIAAADSAMPQNWVVQDYLKKLTDDDFIILDDIGSGRDTEWTTKLVEQVIDFRYKWGESEYFMPTIFTSNCDEKQLRERFSQRTCDRLFDANNIIVNTFGMGSLRQEGL